GRPANATPYRAERAASSAPQADPVDSIRSGALSATAASRAGPSDAAEATASRAAPTRALASAYSPDGSMCSGTNVSVHSQVAPPDIRRCSYCVVASPPWISKYAPLAPPSQSHQWRPPVVSPQTNSLRPLSSGVET